MTTPSPQSAAGVRALSDAALLALLEEDVPYGDLTTDHLGIGDLDARIVFSARQAMTVCGSEEACRLFELSGARAILHAASGERTDALILEAEGRAADLHRVWKVAQVLVELYSGVTSATSEIVAALRADGHSTPLACTRKHFPGTKAMTVKAVRSGGAYMHRLGLSETLLLFHEHRIFLDEPAEATVAQLARVLPERALVVEVNDPGEALAWARSGAAVLQLERFDPSQVAALVQDFRGEPRRPLLAVAGGVRLENAVAYAAAGADLLVSSAPYAARPQDVRVTFLRVG